jgi:hypothetical protein
MVDAAGSTDMAARSAGLENFDQLTEAVASHYAARSGRAPIAPHTPSPVNDWLHKSPLPSSAGRLTPWDFGAGIEIADALKQPSVEAPRYAQMVQHIRTNASGTDSAREAIALARDIGTGAPDASAAELRNAFDAVWSSRFGAMDRADANLRRTP